MGLHRAFTQQAAPPQTVAINQFPNNATITDVALTTTPSVPLPARPTNNRRGFLVENDGTVPVIFGYGSTVSIAARTALLFPSDFYEDLTGWQGPVAVASVGGNGAVNITEMVYI